MRGLEKHDVQGAHVPCARTDARNVDAHRGACKALRSCISCVQAYCLLRSDAAGWNFTSEELWAVNQCSVYPHVF